MKQFFVILLIILTWVLSFINSSGFGELFHSWEKTQMLFGGLSLFILMFDKPLISKTIWYAVFFMAITFILIPTIFGADNFQGASYMSVFLVTYVFANIRISKNALKFGALGCALLGLYILYVYNFQTTLKGWNDNAIAMLGLFSFLIYFTTFYDNRNKFDLILKILITVLYFSMLWKTDSRSSQLLMLAAIALFFINKPTRRFITDHKNFNFWILQIPLIIAIIVIIFVQTPQYQEWNMWSIREFKKTLFNGRDHIWDLSFQQFVKDMGMGCYKFMANYHNSSVGVLSVFGVLGYCAWINLFIKLLTPLKKHLYNVVVYGCYCAFILIYLQQSVELGLVAPESNLLPYMLLGIGLSASLHSRDDKHHNTNIQYR